MSEKHDPADGSEEQQDAEFSPTDPSPFDLSPSSRNSDSKSDEAAGTNAPSGDAPSEIDAGAQELQARPADVVVPPKYPDPPKTIVSERVPEWPTWSDGGLPPLIIYGPASTQQETPPSDLPPAFEVSARDAATPEPEPRHDHSADQYPATLQGELLEPTDQSPYAGEMDVIDHDHGSSDRDSYGTVDDTPEPVDEASAPANPTELDEVFDTIDPMALDTPPDAATDDRLPDIGPEDASPADPGLADVRPTDEPVAIPATLMGEVPDLAGLEAVSPEDEDVPILQEPPESPAAWESATPPSTMSDDQFDQPIVETEDRPPAEQETIVSEEGIGSIDETGFSPDAAMPPEDIEPELALSASDLLETGEAVPVGPVMTTEVEPSPIELATIPPEPADAVPVAAAAVTGVGVAAGKAGLAAAEVRDHDASHAQTAAEFFAHAHEDVERRKGVLSLGLLTRFAGLGGLAACVAGGVVLLLACAGFSSLTAENVPLGRYYLQWGSLWMGGLAIFLAVGAIFWKSWWPSALGATVIAVLLGAGWFGLERYHTRVENLNLLSLSPLITYVGMIGLAVALLGGFFEHRRMREETHVLAAMFTNILAMAGGGVLWMLYYGLPLISK